MTRQEKISAIGNCSVSAFQGHTKNHMSYFIIPLAHDLYGSSNLKKVLTKFEDLGWKLANAQVEKSEKEKTVKERIFTSMDPTNMGAIKSYIYEQMLPDLHYIKGKKESAANGFLNDFSNVLFQKADLDKKWRVEDVKGREPFSMAIELDGIDLWVLNRHLAFFTLRTKQDANDSKNVSEISSRLNRVLREFREVYVDETNHTFTNDSNIGVPLVEWIFQLTTPKDDTKHNSLLGLSKTDLENSKYSMIFNNSYYAKMITAVHIDEEDFNGDRIISKTPSKISYNDYDSIDTINEIPYLLGSTSELYPEEMWENTEQFIYDQVKLGGINIWKNWSGIAIHDSMAFFATGQGSSGIVNQARHGYYFIYMLNLYVNYSLRFFEHKLIDKEFIDIENIYPLYVEKQRLRNQFMGVEIATRFQPNIVHNSISIAMKTDDIFNEIQENINNTLSLTQKNTDVMITAVISIFTFSGIWISQDKLLELFIKHPIESATGSIISVIMVISLIIKRSKVIRASKKFRKSFVKKISNFFE